MTEICLCGRVKRTVTAKRCTLCQRAAMRASRAARAKNPAAEQAHRESERRRVAERIARDPAVGLLRKARAYVHTLVQRGTITPTACACGEQSVKPTWPDLEKPRQVIWRCQACRMADSAQRDRPPTPHERLLAMTLPVARRLYAALPAAERAAIEARTYRARGLVINPGSPLHAQAVIMEAMQRGLM